MTDKQIIIDDIDVSGCAYYMEYGECINENVYHDYCKACSKCTYKLEQQLKRKEQECEELKKELQAQRDFTAHEQKLIYCVAYDETCKTGNDCKQEKCIFKDNIKLKQALVEIKEIAEAFCNACKELEHGRKGRNCMYCNYSKILQKATEV